MQDMNYDRTAKPIQITSDHLPALRELLFALPQFASAFGEPQHLRLVIDSSFVVSDLIWLVKHRTNPSARTNLQEAVASGTVTAFAPTELRSQIEKHLPRIAAEEQIPGESLYVEWRSYQACLIFCQAEFDPHVRVVNPNRDPNDLPFIYLVANVGAAAVLTKDKDLPAMGAPTAPIAIVLQLREYARGKVVELSILAGSSTVVTGVSVGAIKLVSGLVTALARGFARLPNSVKLLLILGATFAILHPKSRTTFSEIGNKVWDQIGFVFRHVEPVLSKIVETYHTEHEKAVHSWEAVSQSLPIRRRVTLKTHAYAACHAARQPLTLQELERKIRLGGYKPRGCSTVLYLHKVLRRDRRFIRCADGRWTVAFPLAQPT